MFAFADTLQIDHILTVDVASKHVDFKSDISRPMVQLLAEMGWV